MSEDKEQLQSRRFKIVALPELPVGQGVSTAWMLTFTDLVSLMLTFFVLLFSMSELKDTEWEAVVESLNQTLQPSENKAVSVANVPYNVDVVFRREAISLDYLTGVFTEAMQKNSILSSAQLMRLEDRMVISLPGDSFFLSGKAEITEDAVQALFVLSGVLSNIGNQVAINGHSDNMPTNEGFTSNWELSVARAISVSNELRNSGYPDDIMIFGFADTRFSSLPEMPEELKKKMARRVNIIVMATSGTI